MRIRPRLRARRDGVTNQEGDAESPQTLGPRRDLMSLCRRFAVVAALAVAGLGLAAAMASCGRRLKTVPSAPVEK